MCGISCVAGKALQKYQIESMVEVQNHRGPDDRGWYINFEEEVGLGHNRLSVIDLSIAGHQPMSNADGSLLIVFNGEIYNYLELKNELNDFQYKSNTDTEVILAAYEHWGERCLNHFIGMFAIIIWDRRRRKLFAARDRFGVKPLYIHTEGDGSLFISSEIKAIHAAGIERKPDLKTWATYFRTGMYDHGHRTFWNSIYRIPPGGYVTWDDRRKAKLGVWYNPAIAIQKNEQDERSDNEVEEELLALFQETILLRCRSDVKIGLCLSGGLDSSLLLGLIHKLKGDDSNIDCFTFCCNDPGYDETPWVKMALGKSRHPHHLCILRPEMIPDLALSVQSFQDEPFGGFPTIAMSLVHERAKKENVTVLLDGNGVDEGWAGYDYYQHSKKKDMFKGPVQGTKTTITKRDCLKRDFSDLSVPFKYLSVFDDALKNFQYRDIGFAKIPRVMRFNDRVSMMYSRELREPCLDHRIVELGLRQPLNRKIRNGQGKWLVRKIARNLLPNKIYEAPKRAVQTPQREWLRGPLAIWAEDCIFDVLKNGWGKDWFRERVVRKTWKEYLTQGSDNSFPIWQWINLWLIQNC